MSYRLVQSSEWTTLQHAEGSVAKIRRRAERLINDLCDTFDDKATIADVYPKFVLTDARGGIASIDTRFGRGRLTLAWRLEDQLIGILTLERQECDPSGALVWRPVYAVEVPETGHWTVNRELHSLVANGTAQDAAFVLGMSMMVAMVNGPILSLEG